MKLPVVDQAEVAGKRVFVRGDIDVPLERVQGSPRPRSGRAGFRVQSDTRLRDIWPTVEYLLNKKCTVLLAGHLGRPGGKEILGLSSKPVAGWIREKVSKLVGQRVSDAVSGICLKGNICGFIVAEKLIVLENLRFDPREEANDLDFARQLADLSDIYVNEAFATCEREHASIVGVPKFLPHYAGFRLAREVEVLSGILENPKRPLVVVVGGGKLETKMPLINRMKSFADTLISRENLVATPNGLDTTLDSIERFAGTFSSAGTIVWNGPVGKIEEIEYQVGTKKLAELIAASPAYKIVGGGDTVGFLDKLGLADKFDWVSSGGGSMLKFLSGEKLPGVEVLLS